MGLEGSLIVRPFGEGNTFIASGQLVHLQRCRQLDLVKTYHNFGVQQCGKIFPTYTHHNHKYGTYRFDQEHIIKRRGEECVTPKFVKPAESPMCTKYTMLVVAETF